MGRYADGKVVNHNWWCTFCENHGIVVKNLPANGKPIKKGYVMRTPPQELIGVDGSRAYVAGSRPKKITAAGLLKQPKFSIRNDVLKIRPGIAGTLDGEAITNLEINTKSVDFIELWITANARRPASAKQFIIAQ
jgi:hypothetical protein